MQSSLFQLVNEKVNVSVILEVQNTTFNICFCFLELDEVIPIYLVTQIN